MNNKAKPLPVDLIREALELDSTSASGVKWRSRPKSHFATEQAWKRFCVLRQGKQAGSKIANGFGNTYWALRIKNSRYFVHRIVYFLAYNIDPLTFHIDHIDGNGQNNNPKNLRLATNGENMRNAGLQKSNTSGKKGVTWCKATKKWQACIVLNRRQIYLGKFKTINDAAAAYEKAARELHGEFARTE